jgi:hypothetical protein
VTRHRKAGKSEWRQDVAGRGEAPRRVIRKGKAGRRRVEAVRIEGKARAGRAQPIRARRDKEAQAGDVSRGYKLRRSRGGVAMRRACDKAGRGGAGRCDVRTAAKLGATQRN